MPRPIDITGQRFSRWIVLHRAPNRRTDSNRFALSYWACRCDCGTTKEVRCASLLRGKSQSCGCLRQEFYERIRTHGMSNGRHPEYRAWRNMMNRCRNPNTPNYRDYGGRGIKVCKRWNKFENFLKDLGFRPSSHHSLDRIDVNGSYSPSNCRWSTAEVQVSNRRKITNLDNFTTQELIEELRKRGVKSLTNAPNKPTDSRQRQLSLQM